MKNKSAYVLIISNLVPAIGVLFFGWNVNSILILYWLENIVVGFYNVFKIRHAEGKVPSKVAINGRPAGSYSKRYVVLFFLAHFGLFTFVHGVIIFLIAGRQDINFAGIGAGLISLFLSHGYSFYFNFLGKDEYLNISPSQQMVAPYGRILVTQMVVIFGSVLIFSRSNGFPAITIIFLVLGKIIIDLYLHLKEHSKVENALNIS